MEAPFLVTPRRRIFCVAKLQDGTLSSSDLLGALDLSTNTATAPNAFPNVLPSGQHSWVGIRQGYSVAQGGEDEIK